MTLEAISRLFSLVPMSLQHPCNAQIHLEINVCIGLLAELAAIAPSLVPQCGQTGHPTAGDRLEPVCMSSKTKLASETGAFEETYRKLPDLISHAFQRHGSLSPLDTIL